jgi:hypothetical protein
MPRSFTSFAVALSFASLMGVTMLTPMVSGCSSSSSGGATVTAADACTQLANAYCDKLVSCTTFYSMLAFGDAATCKTRFAAQCVRGLAAPGNGSSPENTAACAVKAPGVACVDLFANDLPSECQPVAGAAADGAACGDDSQCKHEFCAFDDAKATCGTCAAPVAAEAACVNGDCPTGLKCGADTKCHKVGALNDACDANHACAASLACFNGKCVAPAGAGADCDPAGTTTPTHVACDLVGGYWCNLTSKKCETIALNAARDATCGLSLTTGGLTVCEPKSYCAITDATKFSGKCVARVADGAACDASAKTFGGPCTDPAKCIDGTCKLADASSCK